MLSFVLSLMLFQIFGFGIFLSMAILILICFRAFDRVGVVPIAAVCVDTLEYFGAELDFMT